MDMSCLVDNEAVQNLIKDTYETTWSTNVVEVTLTRVANSTSKNNMFYKDLVKNDSSWIIKMNLFAPDNERMVRNAELNTTNYTYHVNTNVEYYPTPTFQVLPTDYITYNGKKYEIKNMANTELNATLMWQEFDLKLIE